VPPCTTAPRDKRTRIVHCAAVPPHLLERLRHHHDARVRNAATRTLAIDGARRSRPAHPHPVSAGRAAGCTRLVYDCNGTRQLPGTLRRRESQAREHDADVDRAYDAAGTTYDFFECVFGRNSLDGHGMHIIGSVHYGDRYDNAFWDGAQMVYGDGDGIVFRSFTTCIDIIAHELSHGVIMSVVPLDGTGESAALDESLADVFGALVKQWSLHQSARAADWIIGSGQYTAAVSAAGLRSLSAPGSAYDDPLLGKDPQPSHMRDYVEAADDRTNAHINSGIPNHAFYRFAHHLGGRAWETAGRVWYAALRSGLSRRCTFTQFAGATLDAANAHGRSTAFAVEQAWNAVGVRPRHHAAASKGA